MLMKAQPTPPVEVTADVTLPSALANTFRTKGQNHSRPGDRVTVDL
jgi:hypothetical protein